MDVREAGPGEVERLAKALARAFEGDPVWNWMVPPGPSRMRKLERFFALEIEHVALPNGTVWATTDSEGAALIMPPGKWKLPISAQARHAPEFAKVFGRRLPHAFGLLTRMESKHLREPHLYVAFVGVEPEAQGRGLGRKLLEPTIEQADAHGLPAYLEASSPDSARLYRRLGFKDVEEVRFAGSPPMALMRRPPGG